MTDNYEFYEMGSPALPRPPLNVPLFRKALEWVRSQATLDPADREWYQDLWRTDGQRLGRDCKTAYCVAGFVAEANGATWGSEDPASINFDFVKVSDMELQSPGQYAGEQLGLTRHERGKLFYGRNTLEDINNISREIFEARGLNIDKEIP